MKKSVFTAGMLSFLLAAVLMPSAVKAADVSVGGSVWVSQWDPFFKKSMETWGMKVSIDPGVLYGPVASIRFSDKLSWSNVLLLGRYAGTVKLNGVDENGLPVQGNMDLTSWRYDLDSILNYSLNRYVKVFGGLKGMLCTYKYSENGQTTDDWLRGMGPGAGVAFSYPILDNMFALFNISGLYLRDQGNQSGMGTYWCNAYGGNTSLSLAYYFPSANLTASAGLRYQQLRYDGGPAGSFADGSDDKFYGLVLSLLYTF